MMKHAAGRNSHITPGYSNGTKRRKLNTSNSKEARLFTITAYTGPCGVIYVINEHLFC